MRALAAALVLAAFGCSEAPAPAPPQADVELVPRLADAARGRELMAQLECNRCHDGTGLADESEERHCVRCHQSIRAGTFDAPAAQQRRWRHNLVSLNDVPSLAGSERHLRADWIARFLVEPYDVRPGLLATMPRLPVSEDDAADIAAALTEGAREDARSSGGASLHEASDPDAGLALLGERGCLGCHAFSGASDAAPATDGPAQQLAPDLRYTRERMTRPMLLDWLTDPTRIRPGTLMPVPDLAADERAQVADAILSAALTAPVATPIPERLALLERPVRFEEVADRVLSRTCWHCHADPDFARGDGGAGNTGGFGFAGRGVNLLDYAGASSGYLDDEGERRSMFADDDGTPHLVRVLMARHAEVAGQPDPGVTGMPLGLPPVPLEDIQLVETWIAQGRPN